MCEDIAVVTAFETVKKPQTKKQKPASEVCLLRPQLKNSSFQVVYGTNEIIFQCMKSFVHP